MISYPMLVPQLRSEAPGRLGDYGLESLDAIFPSPGIHMAVINASSYNTQCEFSNSKFPLYHLNYLPDEAQPRPSNRLDSGDCVTLDLRGLQHPKSRPLTIRQFSLRPSHFLRPP
ncbi:hypothetical protein D9757_001095 [Collybiopsis confluens]|uniref:Uncharacterized protein n=1 Tax=Collybiopsis confluens TaxID=2823264 RepID=A0A8H5MGB2_9AGAR|nr:hypothetical protein D9757_001095 [Collybiopsis confluens]